MKINKIRIKSLFGISDERQYDLTHKVVGLFGENGTGKSSVINSIRFAIGGEKSENIMHTGSTKGAVRIETDSSVIDRALTRTATGSTMTCWLDRSKIPGNRVQESIAENLGTPKENLKILSSKDLEKSLASDAGKILLSYSSDTIDSGDVTRLLVEDALENQNVTESQIREIKFPKLISWQSSKDICDIYKEKRRQLKADINANTSMYKTIRTVDLGTAEIPDITQANTEYEELLKKEALQEKSSKLLEEYNKANAQRQKTLAELEKKDKELNGFEDAEKLRNIDDLKLERDRLLAEGNKEVGKIANAEGTISALSPLYDKMGTGICPLSSERIEIKCQTDMTETKNFILQSIAVAKETIKTANENRTKLGEKYNETTKLISKAERYHQLQMEIDTIRKNLPAEIKKPDIEITPIDARRKAFLQAVIKNHEAEKQKKELLERKSQLQKEYYLAEFMVVEFGEKGAITKALLDEYIETLNQAAEKAEAETGIRVLFTNNEGIKILYSVNRDAERPYCNLSSGEKMIAFLTVSDLLHRIANIPVLVIDDVDKLDLKNFDNLLTLLDRVSPSYENIILAGVNHYGFEDILAKHNIPNLLKSEC